MALQPVEDRVSAYREFLSTCLAYQILDALFLSMTPVSHQRMDTFIYDVEVNAFSIIAGVTLGRNALFSTAPISYLTPWAGQLTNLGPFRGRRLFFSAYGAIIRSFWLKRFRRPTFFSLRMASAARIRIEWFGELARWKSEWRGLSGNKRDRFRFS
jgi:hypothetical protein